MFWLLLATGFSGAMTLVFLVRMLHRNFVVPPSVEMVLVPENDPSEQIVQELVAARREVLLQGLSFSSDPVARALVEAERRGVTVEVLLDCSDEQEFGAKLHYLTEEGLSPRVDEAHALLRRQFLVVDRRTVITGSAPFSNVEPGAESPADVVFFFRENGELATACRDDFYHHQEHSRSPRNHGAEPSASHTLPFSTMPTPSVPPTALIPPHQQVDAETEPEPSEVS